MMKFYVCQGTDLRYDYLCLTMSKWLVWIPMCMLIYPELEEHSFGIKWTQFRKFMKLCTEGLGQFKGSGRLQQNCLFNTYLGFLYFEPTSIRIESQHGEGMWSWGTIAGWEAIINWQSLKREYFLSLRVCVTPVKSTMFWGMAMYAKHAEWTNWIWLCF